jgi:hypothetical protein
MYEPKPYEPGGENPGGEDPGGDPTGNCKCDKWPVEVPNGDLPLRRLILALKEAVKDLPPEATKKFEDELKDAEKESQGILAVVNKYKEFYDKLDCRLAEAKTWKEDIARWLVGKIDQPTADAITEFRKTHYEDVEKKICCDWLVLRDQLNKMRDCLEQAKRTEEERKKDYDDFKVFEKTLGDQFTLLKSLYDQAKALNAEQRYKGVFALSLEYGEVYDNLGLFRSWAYARSQCPQLPPDEYGQPCEQETPPTPPEGGEYATGQPEPPPTPSGGGGYGGQPPARPEGGGYEQGEGGLKTKWTPEKFKNRLTCYLRELILAKYQSFRWQLEFQTKTTDTDKGETACKDFRKERQKQFVDEADEVQTPKSSGGGNGENGQQPPAGGYPNTPPTGGSPETPPTGGYQPPPPPTGGYTKEPPTGGGYQQKPPAGNYPDKPTHPPTGDYEDTPVQPPDTYQSRQKK